MSSCVAGYHVVDVDFISRSYTKGQSGMLLETLAYIKFYLQKFSEFISNFQGNMFLVTIVQEFGEVLY